VQSQLRNLSLQDSLTGLHNRHGFLILAEQQMKLSRRNQSPSLLLFFDLDGLKRINDSFGHDAGSRRAILEFAGILRSSLRQCDIIARLGGDEFAALILGASESAESVIRTKLLRKVDEFNSQRCDRPYRLSFSLGIAFCDPRIHISVTDILKKADALMYEEKRTHKAARGRGATRVAKISAQPA
jgi:diguanylate cyclase (GGDEF)-like protein